MDDYLMTNLNESKNEWCARLLNILTPAVILGLKSIFDEAYKLCIEKKEEKKYLMTFQIFLTRVPKWNAAIITAERQRIVDSSGCKYLEDLITCVHVIQLKALSCVRVGQKQKKVDIDIPSLDNFIHKVYINCARAIYTKMYLYAKDAEPLKVHQHHTELENLIKECILNSVRENIPVEMLLRAYMDETEEQDVDVLEEVVPPAAAGPGAGPLPDAGPGAGPLPDAGPGAGPLPDAGADATSAPTETGSVETGPTETASVETGPVETGPVETGPVETGPVEKGAALSVQDMPLPQAAQAAAALPPSKGIQFNDIDMTQSVDGKESSVMAPKTEERLATLAELAHERRKREAEADEDTDDEDDNEKLSIGNDINLDFSDVKDLGTNKPFKLSLNEPPLLDGVVELF
jgi:hypothetical protein